MFKKQIIIFFIILLSASGFAQPMRITFVVDSLFEIWKNPANVDTIRLKAIEDIAWDGYLFTNPDSAFYYAQIQYDFAKSRSVKNYMASALNTQAVSFYMKSDYSNAKDYQLKCLKIREKIGDKRGIAKSLNNLGSTNQKQGNYSEALEFYSRGLKIFKELQDKKGISGILNNIGIIHENRGDYSSAVNYYIQSLKIKEEVGDQQGISSALNNIGAILYAQGDYERAIDHYGRSLVIRREIGDKAGIAGSLNNIGVVYHDIKNNEQATQYYTESFQIFEEIGDMQGVARVLNNIGTVYLDTGKELRQKCSCQNDEGNFKLAASYFLQSLKIRKDIGDKQGMARVYNSYAEVFHEQKNYSQVVDFHKKALALAQEVGMANETRDAAYGLYNAYKAIRQPHLSLQMHELFVAMRDSIRNEENQKEVIRQQFKYKYDKQAAADSVAFAKESEIKQIEIARQQAEIKARKNQQYGLFGGLILALVFAGFLYNRFKVTSQQKKIIEVQKTEVEKKNYQVTQSIEYASRLQKAILPPVFLIKEYLPNSFVLYKPRDIVAGDIYWTRKIEDTVFFAVADCTGHGVPAAMVSVVCCNALNRVVGEFGISDPGQILDKTRELVLNTFIQSEQQVYEGMDISLCAVNELSLNWAGANNPLWLIRNGDLIELKPDRQPIGKSDNPTPFTTHQITLEKSDMIYAFSDGFPDQFGGPNGKKYKSANFKNLLVTASKMSIEEQCQFLDNSFAQWKGNHQQLDDVCIIGIRV